MSKEKRKRSRKTLSEKMFWKNSLITNEVCDTHKDFSVGIRTEPLVCLFIGLLTLAIYWPVANYEFINFDDNVYVTENRHIQNGLTLKSIAWSFSLAEKDETFWHPLTWLSHTLDFQIYGLDPGMHHLTSLIIHILNSVLLFLVFKRMTGELWKSAFVAVLFALHPINVDSVAWVSERKNVLSTFFWILTLLTYVAYCKRPGFPRYFLTCLVFSLGLLTKPMLVTLPCVMLLMDYWPLTRIRSLSLSTTFQLIIEKTPLFILSGLSIYLSTSSLEGFDTMISMEQRPMVLRIENALVSYVSYIGKFIWPRNLAIFYPYPNMIPLWKVICSGLFLVSVSLLVVLTSKRKPYFVLGWFWFLGTLVPVIGLVQPGLWPAMSDRWAYAPFIGLFIIISWWIPDLFISLKPLKKRIIIFFVCGFFITVILITWRQVRTWENSITVFSHAIAATTENYVAHTNLGEALSATGELDRAKMHFIEALRINPNDLKARFNLGVVLSGQNKTQQAIEHYQKTLSLNPDFAEAANNLAWIYATHKNPEFRDGIKAVEIAGHAVKVFGDESPLSIDALDTLAAAYAETGQYDKALQTAQKALRFAKPTGNSVMVGEIYKRILLYKSNMPIREE